MKNDKIIYVILLLIIIFISVGCNNKTSRKEISDLSKSDVDSMVKVVHDLYKTNRKTHESMIAVPATFVPKIKITSELRNTELQEYLVSDIHENNLQQTYEIESEKDLVFDYSLSLYKKG